MKREDWGRKEEKGGKGKRARGKKGLTWCGKNA